MIDVTFQPLHGQDEVAIAGLIFKRGETKAFGQGGDLTDEDAAFILLNPNFIDAELGRNPNYTCSCGKPLPAYVQTADGLDRSEATSCGSCDVPSDEHPGAMPAELAAALSAYPPEPEHVTSDVPLPSPSDDDEPHLHDDN